MAEPGAAATEPAAAARRSAWEARCARLFVELERPAQRMVRRAFGSSIDDAAIEDIYSSAWDSTLRALRERGPAMDDDELRAYLYTAVANHAAKERRRRARKPTAPIPDYADWADPTALPDSPSDGGQERDLVRDLLTSMPPRRRAVMLLRYGWGLEPGEVCALVGEISPRSYRKEITRGIEELTRKLGMVERGEWCRERRALLEAFAAGVAEPDERMQAEYHVAHCRECREFVGELNGRLHSIIAPIALVAATGGLQGGGLGERLALLLDRLHGWFVDLFGGGGAVVEPPPGVAATARGAGAAGGGIIAKVAGAGIAGKAALACFGAAAVTGCLLGGVVPGIDPLGHNPAPDSASGSARRAAPIRLAAPVAKPSAKTVVKAESGGAGSTDREPKPKHDQDAPVAARATAPVDGTTAYSGAPAASPAPAAPAVEQEFGLPGAASSSGGAEPDPATPPVQQEFGP